MQNQALITKVIQLAREERRIGVEILELLLEIERRKAYSALGYDGLFSFCVKELRYSEAQAVRRIQAMRAMQELPELKTKIESGALTVTTVAQVHTHLRQEKKKGVMVSISEKSELFAAAENQSAKQVEAQLLERAGEERAEWLNLKLNPELKDAWELVKGLSAHSTRGDSVAVLEMLMKAWLEKNDPMKKEEARLTFVKKVELRQSRADLERGSSLPPLQKNDNRHIPAAIRNLVWVRDGGRCRNCQSRFAIEPDHIIPFAKGGTYDPSNLRLLCRSCNLAFGIRQFGTKKMMRASDQPSKD